MKVIGKKIVHYNEIDSTNDEARRLIGQGAGEGLVVTADSQTRGRGKFGSSWFSPPGVGLYLSAVVKPFRSPSDLGLITMVGAEAVVAAIKDLAFLGATIKKPNDILINKKKVAGILTERLADGHLIIGIGLNVNYQGSAFPPDLAGSATSLFIESGKTFKIEETLTCLLAYLDDKYLEYLARI